MYTIPLLPFLHQGVKTWNSIPRDIKMSSFLSLNLIPSSFLKDIEREFLQELTHLISLKAITSIRPEVLNYEQQGASSGVV